MLMPSRVSVVAPLSNGVDMAKTVSTPRAARSRLPRSSKSPVTIVTPRAARAAAPADAGFRVSARIECPRASSSRTRWPPCFPVAPVTSTFNLPDMSCSLLANACSFVKQPLGCEGSDGAECLSSSVEPAHSGDESMRHSQPYVQRGVDARRDGTLHVTARVVEQHFVVSNVNADWRQAAQITEQRRRQRILRIGLTQIRRDEPGRLRLGEIRIRFRSYLVTLTRKREVGHW